MAIPIFLGARSARASSTLLPERSGRLINSPLKMSWENTSAEAKKTDEIEKDVKKETVYLRGRRHSRAIPIDRKKCTIISYTVQTGERLRYNTAGRKRGPP